MRARDLRTLRQRAQEQRADPVLFAEPEDGPEEHPEWECWLCGTQDKAGGCTHSKPWECPQS